MNRLSITFYPEIFAKIQDYADQKKISSAQAVREMVDIGLKVHDQMAAKKGQTNDQNQVLDKLKEMQNLIKKSTISGYENLYLTRYAVLNISGKSETELDRVIDKAKIKSKAYIEGLSDKT